MRLINICILLCGLGSIFSCDDRWKKTKSNTFKYNLSNGLSSLDPAFAKDLGSSWVCGHIYERLFSLDSLCQVKPALVDSFCISADGLKYHFQLKKNIYFHKNTCFKNADSTRKLNAYDVQYSFLRLLDSNLASPGAWVLNKKLDSLKPFQILDSFHISIQLRRPCPQFLSILTMPYCSILPHEAVDYYKKDFRSHPVGTGPFAFYFWKESEVLFLRKHILYPLKDSAGHSLPYLDFIKITFHENKKTELFSFEKGELSFITGLDQSILQQVFTAKGQLQTDWKNKSKVYIRPFLHTEYIAFHMQMHNSPIQRKALRKAINYSLNREEIVRSLKYNLVKPAYRGFVADGMPNHDFPISGYTYQPEKAHALLLSEGYNAIRKPRLSLSINNSMIELAELIAKQLERTGFSVEIKLYPADMMMQLAAEGKLEFFRRSWMADYPDAENFLACFYSKNGSPPNYTRFHHPAYDLLYEKLSTESDRTLRKDYAQQMEAILLEESPFVPIFYDQSIRMVQPNILGMEQNALNDLDLRRVRILR